MPFTVATGIDFDRLGRDAEGFGGLTFVEFFEVRLAYAQAEAVHLASES